ncbi:MAG: site-specific DNA-methyltransferase [Rhodospirillales bacterium]|nr:site-specific DNA-methyltransferase [Rhodospirillales bacterium]
MTLRFLPGQIELWPIDRLKPYANNARTHSADQIAKIAGSLAEFGWTTPVLVADDGEIIAGHGRVLAAAHLGLSEVPVIRLDHLTPAQVRAYRLADNRLAELAGWDDELLAIELAELGDLDFDLDLTGFGGAELDRLLTLADGEGEGADDEDIVPEPTADPVCRPGDLWLLGEHRLLCGDATVHSDVEQVLAGMPADMCFTDPPYNVDYSTKGAMRGSDRRILNDNLGDGFAAFLQAACANIVALTRGAVYICMSSSELHTLKAAFTAAGGHWSTFLIWAKNTFTLGRADYQRQYEPILYGWAEGGGHYWCGARDQGDVWFVDKPTCNDLHPTMKPVELVERAIVNSSRRGDVVLDPFAGSGTALMACERTGRRARLVELDPAYCDVIIERWQAATGRHATLDGDGRTLAEAADERLVRAA